MTKKLLGKMKDKMPCNKPRKSTRPGKDHMVKACDDGEEKIIHYGDSKMPDQSHKKSNKKSFRARHNCDDKKDKMTAGYWACKDW